MRTVARRVCLEISERDVENVAADIVKTMPHVTISVECVWLAARMDILSHAVTILARQGITAVTALLFVLLIVRRVDTQTDCVVVRQDGWVTHVMQNVFILTEKIALYHAVTTVSIKHVTDLTAIVQLVV